MKEKPKYRNFSDMQKYQLLEAGQFCRCVEDIKSFRIGTKFSYLPAYKFMSAQQVSFYGSLPASKSYALPL